MTNAAQQVIEAIPTTSPISADVEGAPLRGGDYDHALMFIDFTLGSLTSLDITLQFSLDNSTWRNVKSTQQNAVSLALTANTTAAFVMGVPANGVQMSPAMLAAPYWRLKASPTGTATGSSIQIQVMPFSFGDRRY